MDNLYFCLGWIKDTLLLQEQQIYQDIAPIINLNGMDLICHMTTQFENWCIGVSEMLLDPTASWYCQTQFHMGKIG